MAVAGILTAWATYQSARWSSVQSTESDHANQARIESTALTARATSLTAIDVDVFLAWLEAIGQEIADGTTVADPEVGYRPVPGTRSAFYYERMRDEMLPAMQAWVATHPLDNPDAPKTPFAMAEYRLADAERAAALLLEAEEHASRVAEASRNSVNYVLTAVVLALAIFFAGISTKLEAQKNQQIMVITSDVVLVGGLLSLLILPKLLW